MSNIGKTTCGPLFRKALELAESDASDVVAVFSYGHLCGQAEKVYLGACYAAMFRPSEDERRSFQQRLKAVCEIYSLFWMPLDTDKGVEFWISRWANKPLLERLELQNEIEVTKHGYRGMLCGVPIEEIDWKFDNRY